MQTMHRRFHTTKTYRWKASRRKIRDYFRTKIKQNRTF